MQQTIHTIIQKKYIHTILQKRNIHTLIQKIYIQLYKKYTYTYTKI